MLSLQGALNISVDGIVARFEANGDVQGALRLDLDDPVAFLRASGLFHQSNLSLLRLLARQLAENGLTLTIVSRENTLVVMGDAAHGGMASSLLGIPHLEIRGAGLLGRIAG